MVSSPVARVLLVGLLALCGPRFACAEPVQVRALALFPGKAMLSIDGDRRVLAEGEEGPAGVRLISADPDQAVIEVEGRRQTLGLSNRVGGTFARREAPEARIWRNNAGSYTTVGSINGRMVDFLVDTGASAVALSQREADRLGLQYRLQGEKIGIRTASGATRGYAVTLDRVRIGDIRLRNVRAVVIRGDHPEEVLLGMSFLDRVQMENRGRVMVLRSKFE